MMGKCKTAGGGERGLGRKKCWRTYGEGWSESLGGKKKMSGQCEKVVSGW